MEDYEAEQRAAIIAASGSGGSAVSRPLGRPGSMKFGEETFGGEGAALTDDAGNPLTAEACGQAECIGSHLWGEHRYCAGPGE